MEHNMEHTDTLKVNGILQNGWGIIPKLVMRDRDLTPEAKAIYAYICSYAGNGTTAFPGLELMCHDLNMTRKRLVKHRKQLIDKGYITVEQKRENGDFAKNIYTIEHYPKPITKKDADGSAGGQIGTARNGTARNGTSQNNPSNINSFNKNSFNKNSLTTNSNPPSSQPKKETVIATWEKAGFGMASGFVIERLYGWVDDFNGNEDLIVKAIEEAAAGNPTAPMKYFEGILKRWEQKGIRTVDDLKAEQAKHQRQQQQDPAPANSDWAKMNGSALNF